MKNNNLNRDPDLTDNHEEQDELIFRDGDSTINFDLQFKKYMEVLSNCISAYFSSYEKQINQIVLTFSKQIGKYFENYPYEKLSENLLRTVSTLNNLGDTNCKSEEDIDVDFTDRQLSDIKKLEINLDDFVNKQKSTQHKKFFTQETIVALITILLTLVGIIQQGLPDRGQEEQTKALQEEVSELKEITENTEKIIEVLKERLSQSTPDEPIQSTPDESKN